MDGSFAWAGEVGEKFRVELGDDIINPMSALAQTKWTAAEYLDFERRAEEKHEFLNGEIFAMSGASKEHNRIAWNLVTLLGPQLDARGCEGFVGDMRVHIPATGLYTYPDLAVACDAPRFEDDELDTLLNPIALFEILSASTDGYDRGKKFAHYRSLDSLRVYVLIAQDEPRIEIFSRRDDGGWILQEAVGLDAAIAVEEIGAELRLREIYARVFSA